MRRHVRNRIKKIFINIYQQYKNFINQAKIMIFQWIKGRQNTGYDKMLLANSSWLFRFDCYFIRYAIGSSIPPHTDPVSTGKHYRLNIVLKKSKSGGEFICKTPIFETSRIKFFRPDACEHSVTVVGGSPRYVFSIGWILN
jgi:hypothetical protein